MMPAFARSVLPAAVLLFAWQTPLSGQADRPGREPRRAIVGGSVVDHETQAPIPGARLTLRTGQGATSNEWTRTSDDQGRFDFEVLAGEYILSVSSLGYRTFTDSLHVEEDTNVRLVIRLSASPLQLEPIVAVTKRRPPFMDGFEERRARDRTHTAFFTAEEIEERNPRLISEMFEMVPGAAVAPPNRDYPFGATLTVAGEPGRSGRGGCTPDVWVDGFLMGDLPVDEMYPPDQIEAVELYTTRHEIPNEFVGPRGCGALVIWLRERGPDERVLPSWQRWLIAFGAIAATVFLAR